MNKKILIYTIFTLSISALILVLVVRENRKGDVNNNHTNEVSSYYSELTKVRIKKTKLNVGKIKVDEAHLAKMNAVLYNAGDKNLLIDRVEVSCQCTSGQIPRVQILPGDSVAIQILYNKTIPGFFYSDVIIHGNFEDSPALLSFEGQLIY